jgi:hypothetical protein
MAIASSADNIRYNGTGRIYAADVAGSSLEDLGELDKLNFSCKVTTESLKSTRNAARATILEVEKEREATISFGLREVTEENLKMALLGSAINALNQSASYVAQTAKTLVDDKYIDLGHLNVFLTKLSHGAISGGGLFTIAETVTGGTSSATGKVGFSASGYCEVYAVSGTFAAGEVITGGTSSKTATLSGVETLEDVIVTNADQSVRYAQGTDYSLDPDYGYIRELSATSTITSHAVEVSYDYEAVTKNYIWGMSAGSVQKKLIFVADKDDLGPRQRWTFHKVQLNLNGDFPLIGEGAQTLQVTGTVLADTTQSSGQEYYKLEMM